VLQFVCECDVIKDTDKEEYMRPFIRIGLDWMVSIKVEQEVVYALYRMVALPMTLSAP